MTPDNLENFKIICDKFSYFSGYGCDLGNVPYLGSPEGVVGAC